MQTDANSSGSKMLGLASSNAIGHGITLLAAPILMRLYSPAEYGVYAIFLAISSFFASSSALRFDLAIAVARGRRALFAVIALCVATSTAVATMLTLILLGLWLVDPHVFSRWEVGTFIWLLPVTVLTSGFNLTLSYYATRTGAFRDLGMTRISQSALTASIQGFLALLGLGQIGLILGDAAGRLAGSLRLSRPLRWEWRTNPRRVTITHLRAVAYRFQDFPKYSALASVFNSAALQVPAICLGHTHGALAAGSFGQAIRILAAPLALIGVAASQVFLGALGKTVRDKPADAPLLLNSTVRQLIQYGVLPVVGCGLLSPFAFPLVFGPDWTTAGQIGLAMTPALAAQMVVSPISSVVQICQKQHLQLIFDVSRFLLTLAAFGIAQKYRLSIEQSVGLFSIVMAITYLVFYMVCVTTLRNYSPRSQIVPIEDGCSKP